MDSACFITNEVEKFPFVRSVARTPAALPVEIAESSAVCLGVNIPGEYHGFVYLPCIVPEIICQAEEIGC